MTTRTRNTKKHSSLGVRAFNSIDEALAVGLADGLTTIKSNGRYFDFFYEDRGAPVTLVTFHSATGPTTTEYPIFSGARFAKNLGVNFLAFADAACGGMEKMLTFWHQSTKRVPSASFIPKIVELARIAGGGRHLVFFGSSAGGFAALQYSSLFPDSAALVINPRIELMGRPFRFDAYSKVAYPGWTPEMVAKKIPTSMARRYSVERPNTVAYLQNRQDPLYYENHYLPFKKATEGHSNVHFQVRNWGKGHVVPPASAYMEPLEALVANAPNWGLGLGEFSKNVESLEVAV